MGRERTAMGNLDALPPETRRRRQFLLRAVNPCMSKIPLADIGTTPVTRLHIDSASGNYAPGNLGQRVMSLSAQDISLAPELKLCDGHCRQCPGIGGNASRSSIAVRSLLHPPLLLDCVSVGRELRFNYISYFEI